MHFDVKNTGMRPTLTREHFFSESAPSQGRTRFDVHLWVTTRWAAVRCLSGQLMPHPRPPQLIGQGANDPRVPLSESEQIRDAVRRANEDPSAVWYVVASDEGHGFRKKANKDFWQQAVVTFLSKHIAV